ncbi:hypothetical protein HAX54_031680, partial [Datura stramonium]|nr:hypothetical protein [Datura stramonium]
VEEWRSNRIINPERTTSEEILGESSGRTWPKMNIWIAQLIDVHKVKEPYTMTRLELTQAALA